MSFRSKRILQMVLTANSNESTTNLINTECKASNISQVGKALDNASGFIDPIIQNNDSTDILQVAMENSFLEVDENVEIVLEDVEGENLGFPIEKEVQTRLEAKTDKIKKLKNLKGFAKNSRQADDVNNKYQAVNDKWGAITGKMNMQAVSELECNLNNESGSGYNDHLTEKEVITNMEQDDTVGYISGSDSVYNPLNSSESDSIDNPANNSVSDSVSAGEENDQEFTEQGSRKRRRKKQIDEWSRQKTKQRRMKGQKYLGYTRNKDGNVFQNKERDARILGPTCSSSKCLKYKTRFCSTINEAQREALFKKFWDEMSWDQKKVYVVSLMEVKPTGRKYVENSRRSTTYNYYLKMENEKKQVCKKMFLATLGLKEWMVTNWCLNTDNGIVPSADVLNTSRRSIRPLSERSLNTEEHSRYLRHFLESLPKMPSHYCRKDTKKLYLEYSFESKAQLYRIYKEHCTADQKIPLSSCYFSETFENLNFAIFSPKKDQCNTCVAFKSGNITETEYNRHVTLKDLARKAKDSDKTKCIEGSFHVFVMDVQAVKMCPVNNANKFYFKTRLKVHNFTIYNLRDHQCSNYWWSEVEGDLSSSVFATMIIDHLHQYCQDDLPIIIWSDGCSYQNRNAVLSNALLQYAVVQGKTIIQKYLEPGHTQMECDSVHSLIERKLKNREIMLPHDYVRKTQEARQKPFPLTAKYMTHDQFRNYDDKELMRYRSIRPGRGTNDPTVTNLREIHYFPHGEIGYKINFVDEIKVLPQRLKEVVPYKQALKLFPARLKITKQKFEHLQDIKSTLPQEYHGFYNNLQYE